jgi:hypothetical protein
MKQNIIHDNYHKSVQVNHLNCFDLIENTGLTVT